MKTITRPLASEIARACTCALVATGVHAVGHLAVTAFVAAQVFEKLGVGILRRAWFNLDLIWSAALVATGALTRRLEDRPHVGSTEAPNADWCEPECDRAPREPLAKSFVQLRLLGFCSRQETKRLRCDRAQQRAVENSWASMACAYEDASIRSPQKGRIADASQTNRVGPCRSSISFIPRPLLAQIQLTPVVSGLASPVFLGNAGDGSNRLFIVEQAGIIKVLQPGSSTPTVFSTFARKWFPVVSAGSLAWPSTQTTRQIAASSCPTRASAMGARHRRVQGVD